MLKRRKESRFLKICEKHGLTPLMQDRALKVSKILQEMQKDGVSLSRDDFLARLKQKGISNLEWKSLKWKLYKIPELEVPKLRWYGIPLQDILRLEEKVSRGRIGAKQLIKEIEKIEEGVIIRRIPSDSDIVLDLALMKDPGKPTGYKFNSSADLDNETGFGQRRIGGILDRLRANNPHLIDELNFRKRYYTMRKNTPSASELFFQRKPRKKEIEKVKELCKKHNETFRSLKEVAEEISGIKEGLAGERLRKKLSELEPLTVDLFLLVEKNRNVFAAELLEKLLQRLAFGYAIKVLGRKQEHYYFVKEREDVVFRWLRSVIYKFKSKGIPKEERLGVFSGYLKNTVQPRMRGEFAKYVDSRVKEKKALAAEEEPKIEDKLKWYGREAEPAVELDAEELKQQKSARMIACEALKEGFLPFDQFVSVTLYNLKVREIENLLGISFSYVARLRKRAKANLRRFVKKKGYV